VDTPTARARSERLRLLGEEKRAAFYRSLLGSTREALVERGGRPGAWTAMTDVYAPVQLREHPGSDDLVPVRVEKLRADGLFGSAGG
jgi:tRNA A37 methylthiotransferase MiaB